MKTENRYATTGFGTGNTIELNMTGSRNPFIFAIRKAFREYIDEQTKGYIFCEKRLERKLEAANLLFPEYREKMKSLTVKN